VGTPPCTGQAISAGTLTASQYSQSFGYDAMGRLTSGPQGSYTYGDPAHPHAATAIGSTWGATYDAAGNMTCRATGSQTCGGSSPTGAAMQWNPDGQLSAWQNAPQNPSATEGNLYDGSGSLVEQQTMNNGTTTTSVFVGDLEEVVSTGGTTTTTTYYYADGQLPRERRPGVFGGGP
jgi:hypothetical protein